MTSPHLFKKKCIINDSEYMINDFSILMLKHSWSN